MSIFSPELQAKLLKEKEQLKNERKKKAKYKIQIFFRATRSVKKPLAFTVSVWHSGGKLHGGGDELMFICRRSEDAPDLSMQHFRYRDETHKQPMQKEGCTYFIPGEQRVQDRIMCPHCGANHHYMHVVDSVFYRVHTQKAAEIIKDWFFKLGCSADIVAKYTPFDPRFKAMLAAYDAKTARELKGMTIYTLENLLKDVSNGSTFESRIRAFMLA